MIYDFRSVAAEGYNAATDVAPHKQPDGAWTRVENMRFTAGRAETILGQAFALGSPAVAPHFWLPYDDGTTFFGIYAGLNKIHVASGSGHYPLTRQSAGVDVDYSASVLRGWNGGVLHGIPILNNGFDVPQMWLPASLSQRMENLGAWNPAWRCGVVRPFKNYLVALDVTKDGTRYPYMVKWSHPADPGTVPSSWDETDPTRDAGEYSLSGTSDFVIDCLPLGNTNIVYKSFTTHSMQLSGDAETIFRFDEIFSSIGAISRECAASFLKKHLVFGIDDLIVHDGLEAQSVAHARVRKWLSANVDRQNAGMSFLVSNHSDKEIWCCFPEVGATYCTRALVWNYRDNTFGVQELPEISHATFDLFDQQPPGETYDTAVGDYDSEVGPYDIFTYNPNLRTLVGASPSNNALVQFLTGTSSLTGPRVSLLERVGIGIPVRDNQPPDISRVKFLSRIFPLISGEQGGVVLISAGAQEGLNTPVVWRDPEPFVIGTDTFVDGGVSGRLLALRFEGQSGVSWQLEGLSLDVRFVGMH
jgi:hypothetical protein